MEIIDGRKLREEILSEIKSEVSALPFVPIFCDVLVGDDPASLQYVKMKAKTAESVGIKFHNANFSASITTDELCGQIKLLNKIKNMCGIIVQLPLPSHLDRQAVLDAIDPHLDVDCLGTIASEKFYDNQNCRNFLLGFPTALACMVVLDTLDLNLTEKNIVVLGQGLLVGKPVAALLKFRGLKPVLITRQTLKKEELIKDADIIISGIGHGKYITGDMIKKGAVLIDAGTSEDLKRPAEGLPASGGAKGDQGRARIIGDVDLESVKEVASYVSPVPGGVGPVTVAMLLKNVLQVAKNLK
ncbi:MAG TPA: bifunctional 5,10-methylenetetrahydrofolate dehydrogenase/5,10-methenyltetrahydrofolate cyclohydrolase [Candidatus Paceibacterota bacterium]|jgi:methylenetetrahydrofolate dehydrogenase (NADP+)/methenyltetrahydrofolate cyclohydrolase|nr:bifunctional 5,10-methylenetetrahydrofolate dehydrogenase/5,10-methenyltetrahydrofolate cyclohydrolase [Candidatus Paceibacterota bacterium]